MSSIYLHWHESQERVLQTYQVFVGIHCPVLPRSETRHHFLLQTQHHNAIHYHTEVSTKWLPFCKQYFNFKSTFLNEKVWIQNRNSLKRVPGGLIGGKTALAKVMAWRLTGDKPLPEPMLRKMSDTIWVSLGHNEQTMWYRITGVDR